LDTQEILIMKRKERGRGMSEGKSIIPYINAQNAKRFGNSFALIKARR